MHQIKVTRTTYRNYGRRNVLPLHSEQWGVFVCEPAHEDDESTPVEIAVSMLQENGALPDYHLYQPNLTYNAPSVDDTGAGDVDEYRLEDFTEEEQKLIFDAITGLKTDQ